MKLSRDFDLTAITTFHVPAQTRWYGEFDNIEQLHALLEAPEVQGMPRMFMGGGSNLLFVKPYEGVIIRPVSRDITLLDTDGDSVSVRADAGVVWDDFVRFCVDNGLYGAENLSYIPGEAGASAVQNVGAYGTEAKDIISTVHVYDTVDRQEKLLDVAECGYGYRDSMFKKFPSRYVVLDVTYRLSRKERYNLEYGPLKELENDSDLSLRKVRERIIDIRRSKLPDPESIGSAGSFFKNPVITREHFNIIKERYADIPSYPAGEGMVKVPAGWLIERAGLKGVTSGGAQVYPRQCLVIVNTGEATADDVVTLYRHVQEVVSDKFGIILSPEVNIIGL